ncbi:MAG: ThaI family type II restriction endonuclease [Aquificaceae bacterium]
MESSKAGKTRMEVGSMREKVIIALLIYKFGEAKVETEIPITESCTLESTSSTLRLKKIEV